LSSGDGSVHKAIDGRPDVATGRVESPTIGLTRSDFADHITPEARSYGGECLKRLLPLHQLAVDRPLLPSAIDNGLDLGASQSEATQFLSDHVGQGPARLSTPQGSW
jgi:hypothetical protein